MRAYVTKFSWHGSDKKEDNPCEDAVWNNEHKAWFVEIETLDDLLSIGGKLVVSLAWKGHVEDPETLKILKKHDGDIQDINVEIYDTYREQIDMGKKVPKEVTEKRREIVASLMARGMRQAEVVIQLGTEMIIRGGDAINNPSYIVNPNTLEPFDKATINRDFKYLLKGWRENALMDSDDHFSRQLAELTELRRAAWARKDLAEVRQCLALEMKLLGTARPEKLEHSVNPDQLGKVDRFASLFQGMRRQEDSR